MKKILVTGGAGFIGRHLCAALLQDQNNHIICVDNLATGTEKNIEEFKSASNFEFLKHDICQPPDLKVDQIYNLACPPSPADFSKLYFEILAVNSRGVENMLKLAERNKARIAHASTSEVYGDPLEHPQKESYWGNTNSYGPRSCYDEGKRFAEAQIYYYRHKRQVNTAMFRVFNTYGPYMRQDDGRVVSDFIVQALKNEPLTVYGDGQQTRSFCYVSDLVEGIIKMMDSQEEGPINLGNPGEFTINNLAKKVIEITKTKSKIVYKSLPQDDPRRRRPDITLAKHKLNWEPRIKLEEGLVHTINYFKNHL